MDLDNPKFAQAIARIEALFIQEFPVSAAFSSGKDSSVLMDITLHAARNAKAGGANPFILVMNGDTGVENPEIAQHPRKDAERLKHYAAKHGINLQFHVAEPTLNDTWAVQVISGRSLPSCLDTVLTKTTSIPFSTHQTTKSL